MTENSYQSDVGGVADAESDAGDKHYSWNCWQLDVEYQHGTKQLREQEEGVCQDENSRRQWLQEDQS